jgi:hypothetical protein
MYLNLDNESLFNHNKQAPGFILLSARKEMRKTALGIDISNTASEEERKFNKILGIQGQAFIMREREGIRSSVEMSRESRKQ